MKKKYARVERLTLVCTQMSYEAEYHETNEESESNELIESTESTESTMSHARPENINYRLTIVDVDNTELVVG